jgi:hypothetical protein
LLFWVLRFPAAEAEGQGPTDFPNIDHRQNEPAFPYFKY